MGTFLLSFHGDTSNERQHVARIISGRAQRTIAPESKVTGKAVEQAGEVLTAVGPLVFGMGALAAKAVRKSAPKMLRVAGTTLRAIADSMERRK